MKRRSFLQALFGAAFLARGGELVKLVPSTGHPGLPPLPQPVRLRNYTQIFQRTLVLEGFAPPDLPWYSLRPRLHSERRRKRLGYPRAKRDQFHLWWPL